MNALNNFSYQILGTPGRPRLVFLHGLMGSGVNWRKVTSKTEGNFEILTFDQRGHGRSFKPETGYTYEHYSQDIENIAKELNWESFHLVGHSMGGRNALHYAANYSHRVTKLIIEDAPPFVAPDRLEKNKELLLAVPTPFGSKLEARDFFLKEFEHLISHPQAKQIAQYLLSNIEKKENGMADWRFSLSGILETVHEGIQRQLWDELCLLSMPTFVVRGSDSEILSQKDFQRMLEANECVTGVEIPNAGHWVHADRPEEFTREILDFLSK